MNLTSSSHFYFKITEPREKWCTTTPLCKDNLDYLENSNRRVIKENSTQSKNAIDLDKTQYLYIYKPYFLTFYKNYFLHTIKSNITHHIPNTKMHQNYLLLYYILFIILYLHGMKPLLHLS